MDSKIRVGNDGILGEEDWGVVGWLIELDVVNKTDWANDRGA